MINLLLDNRYEIHSFVGLGGMGTVYRARDLLLNYDVAVKILMLPGLLEGGQETVFHERFRREAKAAACSSSHPNVVTVHYVGEARVDQPAYIAMSYVEGESSHDLLKRENKLLLSRAVALMIEICAGVGAAHQNQALHRDLKPQNVIVIPPDKLRQYETVKVVDFGIAKLRGLFDGLKVTQITNLGQPVGTPQYMSPEQWSDEILDDDNYSSDVYSLGIMLYEMLKGECPFKGNTSDEYREQHLHKAPPPLGIPQALSALEQVIMSALEKEHHNRPVNAIEFGLQIRMAWQEAIENDRYRVEEEQRKAREEEEARHEAKVVQLKQQAADAVRFAEEEQRRREEGGMELEQGKTVIARMNFELKSAQDL